MTNTVVSASVLTKSVLSVGERENRLLKTSTVARYVLMVVSIFLFSLLGIFIVTVGYKPSKWYNITTCTLFGLADILLVTMLLQLICTIEKYFKADLQKETV